MAKKMGSAATEYIHLNGNVLAEYNVHDLLWNDYIFAGSRRLAAAGTDDLLNLGFEQGMEGWTWGASDSTGTAQVINYPSRAHSGSNYLQLSDITANSVSAGQVFSVNPGDQLTFGGWAYIESGSASATGVAWDIWVSDVNGNILAYVGSAVTTQGQWTKLSTNYTVPAGGVTVGLYCQIYQPKGSITARFDDAFLTGATGQGARYYHADHLGSARLMTDGSGNQTWSATYLPFGQEWNPQATTNHYKFTGKERDSESGLDNFGARYNSSSLGRWMSPDPSNQGIDFYFPQSWNHYAYVLNNPLRMVDPNGLWPTWVHNDIIGRSFTGMMSKEQRQILKDVSAKVDSDQSTAGAYKHGMANGNDASGSVNAMQDSADFIKQNEHDAEVLQQQWIDSGHTGLSPAALQAFGNALHTITDETSPSHEGFQPWYGLKDPLEWPGDAWHFLREACPGSVCQGNRRRQQEAVDRALRAFSLVFWNSQHSQPQATVTVTTCITGPDGKKTCTTY